MLPFVAPHRGGGVSSHVAACVRQFRSLVPRVNNKTGQRIGAWPAGLGIVMPLPNPTLAFDAKAGTLSDLDPQQFQCLGSFVVLFAPHLFWPGLVEIKCPLCGSKAIAHGWSTSIRRITGLFGVWYLNGTRYKCTDCTGGLGCAVIGQPAARWPRRRLPRPRRRPLPLRPPHYPNYPPPCHVRQPRTAPQASATV